eukprot:364044-Chlamydomonas_euryale.AAC.6
MLALSLAYWGANGVGGRAIGAVCPRWRTLELALCQHRNRPGCLVHTKLQLHTQNKISSAAALC